MGSHLLSATERTRSDSQLSDTPLLFSTKVSIYNNLVNAAINKFNDNKYDSSKFIKVLKLNETAKLLH